MGNCCLKKTQKKKIVLLLLGLDNAGKTVAAKNLAGEPIKEVVPTVGFSVIRFPYLRFNVEVFDLGGGSNIRGIWNQYFVDAHGVIFVVDSSDYSRLNEVKEILHSLLSNEQISGKPLLLLANKQDNENALDELDLIENLELEYLVNKVKSPTLVESCSATDTFSKSRLNIGIKRGCNWLLNCIIREYEILNIRVQDDIKQQQIINSLARKKILEKLTLLNDKKHNTGNEAILELSPDQSPSINNVETKSFCVTSLNTNTSCPSIPSICNGTEYDVLKERPKSATQMIKNQLLLEYKQRKICIKKPSNKTQPINLLGSKLLDTSNRMISNDRRLLKSAGDSVYVVPNIPYTMYNSINSGYSDGNTLEMKST